MVESELSRTWGWMLVRLGTERSDGSEVNEAREGRPTAKAFPSPGAGRRDK
jgi:hypothetical protein